MPKISELEIVGEEIMDNGNSADPGPNLTEDTSKDEEGQTSLF